MQANGDAPDLRQTQHTTVQRRAPTILGIGEAVVAARSLKARIAPCLACLYTAKEGLERLLQTTQHLLQDLRVDLGIVGKGGFEVRHFRGLLVVGRALALPALPPYLALFQCG